jgi:hypothetical protein
VSSNFPSTVTNTAIASSTTVVTPFIERFEAVAHDGDGATGTFNHWGGHQQRITHHADGSVRLLYLVTNPNGGYYWRVMKRSAATSPDWTQEASGTATDDVVLVHDPVSDKALVVAWTNSVPTVYASPSYGATTIPGTWQNLSTSSRHYGNVGIGPDGTLCIKASVELATTVPTSNTETVYTCGKYSTSTSAWSWNPQVVQSIGLRHAYDYLFPGGFGDYSKVVATAQWDLYKDAANLPNLATNYVFNGVRFYTTGVADTLSWQQHDPVAPYYAPSTSTVAPVVRPIDAFIDSQSRVWMSYYVNDPLNATPSGLYLAASDKAGNVLYKSQLPLPTYGYVRVFEDAKGRRWVLWTNQGSQGTQVYLYPLNVSGTSSLTVSLGSKTDLSSAFAPYSIQGSPILSLQRGGQTPGNVLEGEMYACDGTYVSGQTLSCSPSGTNTQRVFHFRVRLPD